METAQFDELIRNMSQLMETGEISDDLASQVIYQLVAELTKTQPAHAHWRGIPGEDSTLKKQTKKHMESVPQSFPYNKLQILRTSFLTPGQEFLYFYYH